MQSLTMIITNKYCTCKQNNKDTESFFHRQVCFSDSLILSKYCLVSVSISFIVQLKYRRIREFLKMYIKGGSGNKKNNELHEMKIEFVIFAPA